MVDALEVGRIAIIGVGHVKALPKRQRRKEMDAAALLVGRKAFDVGDVRGIHAEDEVKALEVAPVDLARLQAGQVDAVFRRDRDRAPVGASPVCQPPVPAESVVTRPDKPC